MKLKQRLGESYPFVCTLPIFAVLWVGFYIWSFFIEPTDAMGYALLAFYVVQPLFALISCIYVGYGKGKRKWLAPMLYSLLSWTLPIAVCGAWETIFLLLTFVPGVVGLVIGHVWGRFSTKNGKECKNLLVEKEEL